MVENSNTNKTLVENLLRSREGGNPLERAKVEKIKFRSAVVQAAPKFDGSGFLDFWEKAIRQHMRISGVEEADKLDVARQCL